MNQETLKNIKKILMNNMGYIRLGKHCKDQMNYRGYFKGDIVSCLMKGHICEVQYGYNHYIRRSTFNFVIEGRDTSNNPIVIVLSKEGKYQYSVITVMPPIDHKRFKDCICS